MGLKYKENFTNKLIANLLKLFIIMNLLLPIQFGITNRFIFFTVGNFVAIIVIILLTLFSTRNNYNKKFSNIYFFLLIIYIVVFLYFNGLYEFRYLELINKVISMCMFYCLLRKVDKQFLMKYHIINFFVKVTIISILLSIIYFIMGKDGLNLTNFTIQISSQGYYSDTRLTWIFGHKSTYGMMLILFTAIVIRYKKNIKNYKIIVSLYVGTAILCGSASTLPFIAALIVYNFFSKKSKCLFTVYIKYLIFPIGVILIFRYIIDFIMNSRDISTFGSRTLVYEMAEYYLPFYKDGIGIEFGKIKFQLGEFIIDNFHNIFLNEILMFTVSVGIIYFVIFIVTAIYSIKEHKIFGFIVWVALFSMFFMDYCLRTDTLTIFNFMIYMLFFTDIKSDNVRRL